MKFATLVNGCRELLTIIASWVTYDNTASGLTATNVKTAIDELAASTGGAGDLCIGGVAPSYIFMPTQCVGGGDVDGN